MKAVIISGGSITNYQYIKNQVKDSDIIICADSGYDHAQKLGLKVSAVVGDFDSIKSAPKDTITISYPSKKDFTDTEIAIAYARDKGFTDFLLLGATGGRMDHSLTNILLLKNFLERGETAAIVDEHSKIRLTSSTLCLHEAPGSIVSLVPLSDCYGVCTQSLEYPLSKATLYMGSGLGVSNIMTSDCASVSIEKGLLLIIIAQD